MESEHKDLTGNGTKPHTSALVLSLASLATPLAANATDTDTDTTLRTPLLPSTSTTPTIW